MKGSLLSIMLGISSFALADIVAKPDGTVTCTGECTATIVGGSITICEGKICMEIKRKPKDDK